MGKKPLVDPQYLKCLSKNIHEDFRCCDLHHSSYCPECLGERCENRIKYKLNPKGGNEKKIEQINEKLRKGEIK